MNRGLCDRAPLRGQMASQPSYRPLRPSDFFDDGRSARPLVEGTVPYQATPEKQAQRIEAAAGRS